MAVSGLLEPSRGIQVALDCGSSQTQFCADQVVSTPASAVSGSRHATESLRLLGQRPE